MKGKKIIAFSIVTALLVGIFAACGGGADTTAPAAPTAPGATTPAAPAAPDATPAEDAVIKVFYTKGGFEAPPENDIIKQRMEQDSGVRFEYISPPSANFTEQLYLMLASGEYPDITAFPSFTDPFRFWDEGRLLDLAP
jgi:ABC-type glycerol-3-phosphate transport system substrate-binding protein